MLLGLFDRLIMSLHILEAQDLIAQCCKHVHVDKYLVSFCFLFECDNLCLGLQGSTLSSSWCLKMLIVFPYRSLIVQSIPRGAREGQGKGVEVLIGQGAKSSLHACALGQCLHELNGEARNHMVHAPYSADLCLLCCMASGINCILEHGACSQMRRQQAEFILSVRSSQSRSHAVHARYAIPQAGYRQCSVLPNKSAASVMLPPFLL